MISEGDGRIALDGGVFFAGMSCSTAGGDCATMAVLGAGGDPVETDARRGRGGAFGSAPGARSPPVLVDFLGDAGVCVNPSMEFKLPTFLECPDGSKRPRGLVRRRIEVLWEAVE